MKTKEKKFEQNRKRWFKNFKKLLKVRYKKTEFVFHGQKPTNGAIILSNHEGTDAPLSLEMYCDFPVRFWGTGEMNCGLKNMYKYQTKVYYHEKKHWPLWAARLFCLLASPLTHLFYKGLNLISTYQDSRFRETLKESVEAIKNGDNVVIFPEKSDKGYLETLEGFYNGFFVLASQCRKVGIDVDIYTSYFQKKQHVYIFDKPIKFSELLEKYQSREAVGKYLLDRCNALNQDTKLLQQKTDKN